MSRANRAAALAILPVMAGCSGSGGGSPPEGGGSGTDAPAPEGGTSSIGANCNSVTNGAASVAWTTSASAAPTPAGGAIASGTYFLTSVTSYGAMAGGCQSAASGLQSQETIVVDASAKTVQAVFSAVGMLGAADERTTGTFTASLVGGNAVPRLTFTPGCGTSSFDIFNGTGWPYTATGGAITLFDDETASRCGTLVQVFTRQ